MGGGKMVVGALRACAAGYGPPPPPPLLPLSLTEEAAGNHEQ